MTFVQNMRAFNVDKIDGRCTFFILKDFTLDYETRNYHFKIKFVDSSLRANQISSIYLSLRADQMYLKSTLCIIYAITIN